MLAWLDTHAAAVQALAALATGILTAVLAFVTWRYVRLTAALAQAANAQVEAQRQAAAAQRLRFVGIAAQLGLAVQSLPDDRNDSKIREAVLWGDDDVTQLTTLAATLGVSTAVEAETAAISLRWLADRVRYVKALPLSVDRGGRIPADEWAGHLKIARTTLAGIDQRETAPLALDTARLAESD
jgi:hypothetical protein